MLQALQQVNKTSTQYLTSIQENLCVIQWRGVGHRYLEGVEDFDAAVFGISPAEALVLDPQQRLMLEARPKIPILIPSEFY